MQEPMMVPGCMTGHKGLFVAIAGFRREISSKAGTANRPAIRICGEKSFAAITTTVFLPVEERSSWQVLNPCWYPDFQDAVLRACRHAGPVGIVGESQLFTVMHLPL